MALSSSKISQWQLANVVSHCLVTHINRDTHTHTHAFTQDAWRGAISTLSPVLVVSVRARVCVRVCVCVRDQMGVRPAVSVPCQHQQPLRIMAASLCSIQAPCLAFQQDTHTHTAAHCVILTHDPVATPDQTHTFVRTM